MRKPGVSRQKLQRNRQSDAEPSSYWGLLQIVSLQQHFYQNSMGIITLKERKELKALPDTKDLSFYNSLHQGVAIPTIGAWCHRKVNAQHQWRSSNCYRFGWSPPSYWLPLANALYGLFNRWRCEMFPKDVGEVRNVHTHVCLEGSDLELIISVQMIFQFGLLVW